ncbi:MAG: response regulator [Proteobacteria bacterium]|nr:response regulator [Pseudomonadota bacterium]
MSDAIRGAEAKPSILAIDDTPENLLTLGAALGAEFRLQFATSGAMGLALAEKAPPDLILLDVMMPEMDGYETCRRFKANPRLRTIPVIFVTALGESDAESAGLALGAADYVTKPINVEIARQRIRNLLERERLRDEVEAQRDALEAQRDRLQHLVCELERTGAGLERTVAERTAELSSLAMELLAAEARERREIAGDLHDDLGQNLAVVKLKLSALVLPDEDRDDGRRCRLQLNEVEAMIDRFAQSLRSLSTQLSPPVLSRFGLGPALEWLGEEMERSYGLLVSVDLGEMAPLDETTSSALYRIVRELLINVWKHAGVSEAAVIMVMDAASGRVDISVADEGAGFDAAQAFQPSAKHSYGLFSIKQRLDFIGGAMRIDSQAGKGTTVSLALAAAPGPGVKPKSEGDEK